MQILGDNGQRKEVLSTSSRHSDIDIIIGDNEQLTEAPSASVRHSSIYILDILLRMVRLMHISLSMLLFLCMFALVIMRLSGTLCTAFPPCYLPFIWRSASCIPPYPNVLRNSKWADFPQLMEMQSSKFEQLLDESVALSLEFGKAASETTGMITTMIIDSDFDRANLLTVFDKDAKKTSRSVIRLISRVGSAVDK